MFTMKVLIVEDDTAYRQWLCGLLGERFAGLEIAQAADAVDGLPQALSGHFDLIFTDIRLPHGNGLDLTRMVHSSAPRSLVCVISSHAILEYREAALRNGATHFLVKGESTAADVIAFVEAILPRIGARGVP